MRWEAQCGLDEAVAAVRGGDADRAIATADSIRNRSVLAGLLSLIMGRRTLRAEMRWLGSWAGNLGMEQRKVGPCSML